MLYFVWRVCEYEVQWFKFINARGAWDILSPFSPKCSFVWLTFVSKWFEWQLNGMREERVHEETYHQRWSQSSTTDCHLRMGIEVPSPHVEYLYIIYLDDWGLRQLEMMTICNWNAMWGYFKPGNQFTTLTLLADFIFETLLVWYQVLIKVKFRLFLSQENVVEKTGNLCPLN